MLDMGSCKCIPLRIIWYYNAKKWMNGITLFLHYIHFVPTSFYSPLSIENIEFQSNYPSVKVNLIKIDKAIKKS